METEPRKRGATSLTVAVETTSGQLVSWHRSLHTEAENIGILHVFDVVLYIVIIVKSRQSEKHINPSDESSALGGL